MFHKQHGFTLMELMMVVVIIAVLATLAIPRYQDFVGRAQVADAVVLLTASRVDVEEHILERGYFPKDEVYAVLSTRRSGLYTNNLDVTVSDTCSTAGQIQATMRYSGVSANIAGRTFVIERDIDGNWRCARGGAKALADIYLPNSCRTEAVPQHDYPICPLFKTGNSLPADAGDSTVVASVDDVGSGTDLGGDDDATSGSKSKGGKPKSNNGHGNNYDSVDVSNPGKKKVIDASGDVDDEKGRKA